MQYKSKFENQFAKQHLKSLKGYETVRISYNLEHHYTPDWTVCKNVYIETKGRFHSVDRTKLIAVLKQHPEITLAIVFQDPKQLLYPGSKTTYAKWCENKGIIWFDYKDTTAIDSFIQQSILLGDLK